MPDNLLLTKLFASNPRQAKLVFFLLGAMLMLSFAPFGWYPLAPFLLLPLLQSFLVSSPRTAAAHGFWFGAGLFLTGTYWLYISVHVFGQAPLILAIFLMLALVVIMGLYYAAAGWLTARLCEGREMRLLHRCTCSLGVDRMDTRLVFEWIPVDESWLWPDRFATGRVRAIARCLRNIAGW